jgi:hypothetical protein
MNSFLVVKIRVLGRGIESFFLELATLALGLILAPIPFSGRVPNVREISLVLPIMSSACSL